jgi:hypothetical protein
MRVRNVKYEIGGAHLNDKYYNQNTTLIQWTIISMVKQMS